MIKFFNFKFIFHYHLLNYEGQDAAVPRAVLEEIRCDFSLGGRETVGPQFNLRRGGTGPPQYV